MAKSQNLNQNRTLVERALAKIKKVADGNGLSAATLGVFEPQEKVVTFQGQLSVSAICETAPASYPGLPRKKGTRQVGSPGEIQNIIEKYRNEFKNNPEWYDQVLNELKAHENQGWGLERAKVILPDRSAVFASIQACPTCGGRKQNPCPQCQEQMTIVCPQCQGRGREVCWHCMGRGEDPQRPGQPCSICQGTRYAECRACRLRGLLVCPTCQGRGGVPCRACNATGAITQEVTVTCGAETHFKILHENLPSGLKRGLDRIGIANIPKGHGDVSAIEVPKEKLEELAQEGVLPVLFYSVALPYAEMKVNLGGKKAIVSAVGKKCVLSGIPNFLDLTLKPWREKLHLAALGRGPLEDAMGARAVQDLLNLSLAGKANEKEVRKLYPFGLSSEAIQSMLRDVREGLKRATLRTRAGVASFCVLASALFFFVFFMQGFEARLTQNADTRTVFWIDFGALLAALAASWTILTLSIRFSLQRRFPSMKHSLQQNIGGIGLGMVGAIMAAYAALLLLSPVRPAWLISLLTH
ncbi:MAG: hypothetical protein PHW76_04400 [Alphaproteobacteria bacterium]|nr:hypothetical protein [Alphaproteobacteria bacterium]